MKLLIVSHTPHYRSSRGTYVGWGATVREIDQLASLFEQVVHVAPLHEGAAPASALEYQSDKVSLCVLRRSGGSRLRDKLGVLRHWPGYSSVLWQEMKSADVVHVRCPANVSLAALLLLVLRRSPKKRWLKYAGNWRPKADSSPSYALQRWLLATGWHRGQVTVNGNWPDQPAHVRAFDNPCLTDSELENARAQTIEKALEQPFRLLFVGRLSASKGWKDVLEAGRLLASRGLDFRLDFVGGPEDVGAPEDVGEHPGMVNGIENRVIFHGELQRTELDRLYSRSHFLLLPTSSSEGWPKVLGEAMAFGAVPIASAVSAIPETLSKCGTGTCVPPRDPRALAEAIASYCEQPERWLRESEAGRTAASRFTYSAHLRAVRKLLDL